MSGINLKVTTDSWSAGDLSWLKSRKGFDTCRSITLDLSLFAAAHYADGKIPSGIALGKVTASGKYGPYTGTTEESWTLTEGGSGLTSFTLTLGGQTTASIDDDATAADLLAALEALSNVAVGDLIVTGGPLGTGPFTVTITPTSSLKDTDLTLTSTPTGGTGTVTVATVQAGGAEGGSDGRQVFAGFLLHDVRVADSSGNSFLDSTAGAALLWEGIVDESKLPTFSGTDDGVLDAAAKSDMPSIRYE